MEQEELRDDRDVWQIYNSEMVDDMNDAGTTSDNEHYEEDVCNLYR